MKIVECVQIMCKMQVDILHPAFNTLCCLLLHGVSALEQIVVHLTHAEESVAFWTQTNKLLHWRRIQFVLEESECLAIHSAYRGDGRIGTLISLCSEQHKPSSQLTVTWVFYAHVIVVKVAHVLVAKVAHVQL